MDLLSSNYFTISDAYLGKQAYKPPGECLCYMATCFIKATATFETKLTFVRTLLTELLFTRNILDLVNVLFIKLEHMLSGCFQRNTQANTHTKPPHFASIALTALPTFPKRFPPLLLPIPSQRTHQWKPLYATLKWRCYATQMSAYLFHRNASQNL